MMLVLQHHHLIVSLTAKQVGDAQRPSPGVGVGSPAASPESSPAQCRGGPRGWGGEKGGEGAKGSPGFCAVILLRNSLSSEVREHPAERALRTCPTLRGRSCTSVG